MVFSLMLLLGFYGYGLFFLGIFGLLNRLNILVVSIIFLVIFIWQGRRLINKIISLIGLNKILSVVFLGHILVLLPAVLAPELSFDALWYHLTLPKLYLIKQKIYHIPGGLLYYSGFPQMMEMWLMAGLSFFGLLGAKIISWLVSLMAILGVFYLLKKAGNFYAVLGALIFYNQLAVMWLSTTAYVDLGRVVYEVLALKFFLDWVEKGNKKDFKKSSIMLGLGISIKLLALQSLAVFLILIILNKKNIFKHVFRFLFFTFLVPLPWFIKNWLFCGSFFYPLDQAWFFLGQSNGLNFWQWLATRNITEFFNVWWKLVFTSGDVLSPIMLIGLPLVLRQIAKNKLDKTIGLYLLLNYLIYFFIPLNYNRFFIPYTAAFIYLFLQGLRQLENKLLKQAYFMAIVVVVTLNFAAKAVSQQKYLSYLKTADEEKFIKQNLDFNSGNYYDLDNWFGKNIKTSEKVLVSGIHNLFYIDFNFDDISWAKPGTFYDYLLIKDDHVAADNLRYPIYTNDISGIKVYQYKKIWP